MFCKKILDESESIVDLPFFLETHGCIIASLIKLDEFHVYEEQLWDRLLEWSAAAVRKPELLGPFAWASCPPLKRAKSSTGECNSMTPHEVACQQEVFRLMLPHIRFTQMSQQFFIDKARKHLDRAKSEAVIDFFMLHRNPEGLVSRPRCALFRFQDTDSMWMILCPVDRIQRYFGSEVALYFAWMNHFTLWLLAPAVVGLLCFLRMRICGFTVDDDPYLPFYSLFVIFWGFAFLRSWDRHCTEAAWRWNVHGVQYRSAAVEAAHQIPCTQLDAMLSC
eukprot:s677_g3.t1